MRTKPDTLDVRGSFATGMTGRTPLPPHHGDFGVGVRSRVLHFVLPGDFARGLRASESPMSA